jgi:eukaryotic-like serine/threonine-protein kinase
VNEPSPVDPQVGQVVADRYRLEALIAEGGMGRVYRAMHIVLNEPVVVKFLHPVLASEPIIRQRFRVEAKALIRLRHPGIVAIRDYGEHAGLPYIALELLDGPTLGARLSRDGRLPLPEVWEVFDQLMDVLVATHEAGVIHRDLKPDNVMVLARPGQPLRVTVLDFGIARITDDDGRPDPRLTGTGAVFGTPSFMAPEQCRGRGVVPATDVYSATVMLFLTVTGELPFTADSSAELFAKQLYVAPPTLAERGAPAGTPAGLEALVARGLAKKAAERPSAAEFQRELRAIASGQDDASRRGRDQSARLRFSWQSRDERAAAFSAATPPAPREPLVAGELRARVALWGFSGARAGALVDALAVNGLEGVIVDDTEPSETSELDAALIAGNGWEGRLGQLRAPGNTGVPPVLVADIQAAADIPALVRAGANDVALSTIPDDALVAKLLRLLRRGR